jgi:hypothetical protein
MEIHEKLKKKIEKRALEIRSDFCELLIENHIQHVFDENSIIHIAPEKGDKYVRLDTNDLNQIKEFLENNI